jgi:hypothetical protein
MGIGHRGDARTGGREERAERIRNRGTHHETKLTFCRFHACWHQTANNIMMFPFLVDAIFGLAVAGAGAAALKHAIAPIEAFKELSPLAIRGKNGEDDGKDQAIPAALWWGGPAFACCNVGFLTIGLFAAWMNDKVAKEAVLLGTGVMFEAFAIAWKLKGHLTGHESVRQQSRKVAAIGALFLYGFQKSFFSEQ